MNTRVYAFLLACCTTPAFAADTIEPRNFAEGFTIEAPPKQSLYRLYLTEEVYRALHRRDLRDLAVFNAEGKPVPQALEAVQAAPTPAPEERAVTFYPLRADPAEDAAGGLKVNVNAAGVVVSVEAPAPDAGAQHSFGWVVDIEGVDATIIGLRLEWAAGTAPFMHGIHTWASTDLHSWYPIGSMTLADMTHGAHRLHRDRIDVAGGASRFLRIDWPRDAAPLELQAVHARLATVAPPAPGNSTTRTGVAAIAPDAGWVYDLGGPLPVDRLRVRLAGENDLAELRVFSRASADASWIERSTVLAYRLGADGALLENGEATVPLTRDRYWRLTPSSGTLDIAPTVDFGWTLEPLLFVARGAGPFVLAAGSATAEVDAQPVASVLATVARNGGPGLAAVTEASIGESHPLGGPEALVIPPPPVPWQRYLMWALLIAGVALLLRMAVSLLRGSDAAA